MQFNIIEMEKALDSLVELGFNREVASATIEKWFGKQTKINDVELRFIEIQLQKDKGKNDNAK